jgi:hypothetical protein
MFVFVFCYFYNVCHSTFFCIKCTSIYIYVCVSFAVSTNNGEMVQMLLENGADIDAEDDEVCNTCAHTLFSLSRSLNICINILYLLI